METILEKIIEKHSFENLKEDLATIREKNYDIYIGFLGEFSSGKSSLINAIIDKKVLPAMEKPTSKNIVEVSFSDKDSIQYFLRTENGLTEISPLEFGDYALGRKNGTISLIAPRQPLFRENVILIDTPGLQSMDKMDEDITFGYLPFLDAALICIDVNYGSLTASIIDFLKKPEVSPFLDNVFFAITRAGDKKKEGLEKIKKNIQHQLSDLFIELKTPDRNIESRVFCVDSIDILSGDSLQTKQELTNAFEKNIFVRHKKFMKDKYHKELKTLSQDLILVLEDLKNNLKLDETDILQKEKELESDIQKVFNEKKLIEERLEKLHSNLETSFENISKRYSASIIGQTEPDIQSISSTLVHEINQVVESNIQTFFDRVQISGLSPNIDGVFNTMDTIQKVSEGCKKVGNFALTAWLIPGGAILGNAAQGAGGAFVGKQAAKQAAKQAVKNTGRLFLHKTLSALNEINPVEHLGNFATKIISKSVIEKKMTLELQQFIDQLVGVVEVHIEQEYHEPIRSKIENLQNNLDEAKSLKKSNRQKFDAKYSEVEDDILTLKKALKA